MIAQYVLDVRFACDGLRCGPCIYKRNVPIGVTMRREYDECLVFREELDGLGTEARRCGPCVRNATPIKGA